MKYKINELKPFGVLLEFTDKSTCIDSINFILLKKLFNSHQLVVLRGLHNIATQKDICLFSEKLGEVSIWPFGKVLDLKVHKNPNDHIFDSGHVPLHWDGMYRPKVPEYQVFQCVKAPLKNSGGRTYFSNTTLALESMNSQEKTTLIGVTGIYQRKMEFYNSKTRSPIIVKHPYKNYDVIRYNEPSTDADFINHPKLEFIGIEEEILHKKLKTTLYSPKFIYYHEWQASDILIADNFTLLHGRESFVRGTSRHLRRVQVESNKPFKNPGLEYHT